MTTRLLACWVLLLASSAPDALAQEFELADYYAYVPAPGRPTERTAASKALNLFGRPGQYDPSTTPGLSGRRDARLRALASRFSPILIPTNFSVPRDFEDVLAFEYDRSLKTVACRGVADLSIDVWKTTGSSAERDTMNSRRLGLGVIRAPEPCTLPATADSIKRTADLVLRRLLLELGPRRVSEAKAARGADSTDVRQDDDSSGAAQKTSPGNFTRVRQNADTVLYFDMPGSSRSTWRTAYQQLKGLRSRIYVHPFIHEHEASGSASRFELVLQYWFFYPFNDAVNNHEGDWEHINVSISTLDRMVDSVGEARLLTESDVKRILNQEGNAGVEALAINAVDYYYHGFVVTVDYKRAYEELGRPEPLAEDVDAASPAPLSRRTKAIYNKGLAERFGVVREGIGEEENEFYNGIVTRSLREQMESSDRKLETHPIVYIGGVSVSPLQIAWLPGRANENSHGSFPFPGVWRGVGPFVARERMSGKLDAAKAEAILQDSIPPGRDTLGLVHYIDPCVAEKDRKGCGPDSRPIVLLPDWELLIDSLHGTDSLYHAESAAHRRKWAWLALPVRWGFPATGSPGARIIRGYDFGHTAPIGPAFNGGWNRVGSGPSYARYPLFPLTRGLQQTPWDNIYNSLGVLNTVPTAANLLPPFNIAATLFVAVVHGRRRVYQPTRPGPRNVDFYASGSWGYGGTGFAHKLPPLQAFAPAGPGVPGPTARSIDFTRDPGYGFHGGLILHWGRRLGTENLYARRSSLLSYHGHLDNGSFADVQGTMKKQELLSAFRLGTLLPFGYQGQIVLRAGYGWTWYTIRDISLSSAGGPPFPISTAPSISRGPKLLPNTVLGGVAFESNFQLARHPRTTFGLRVAATAYHTPDHGGRTDLELGGMLGF